MFPNTSSSVQSSYKTPWIWSFISFSRICCDIFISGRKHFHVKIQIASKQHHNMQAQVILSQSFSIIWIIVFDYNSAGTVLRANNIINYD